MKRSDEIAELVAALALAQGEIEAADKASANPHFKSKYADFASVRAVIQGPLSKHGIAVLQFVSTGDHYVEVETMLAHKSGQYMSETLRMPVQQWAPQPIGSATTYAKRYGLQAMVCVPSEDDDGEAAMGRGNGASKATNNGPISDEQYEALQKLIAARGVSVEKVAAYYKVESLADLPSAKFDHAKASIMAAITAAKTSKNGNGHADGAQANG